MGIRDSENSERNQTFNGVSWFPQLGDYIYIYITYHLLREPDTAIETLLGTGMPQWVK